MLKFVLLLSIIALSTSQFAFLEDAADTIKEGFNKSIDEVEKIEEYVEQQISHWIPEKCKTELSNLSSIIDVIKHATGSSEALFEATKDLVNHFPKLNENCGIPLPTIDTSNWTLEKFKKCECLVSIVYFAKLTSTCITGNPFDCAKAFGLLAEVGKCVKENI